MRVTAAKKLAGMATLAAFVATGAAAFAGEAADAAAETAASGNVGFPQLDTSTYASQAFWLAVSFVLLYGLMSKFALPRVGVTLEKRNAVRTDNLDAAEKLNTEAGKVQEANAASLAKAHDAARAAALAAEQDMAEKITAETARFGETSRERLAKAEQNIAKARKDAMAQLSDIASDVAADMTSRIAGAPVAKADAQNAVAAAQKG